MKGTGEQITSSEKGEDGRKKGRTEWIQKECKKASYKEGIKKKDEG